MITYIELCLKLNRAREAKDGLHQYRNLSQSQAPGSLENVIRHLLNRAEAECAEAKIKADAASPLMEAMVMSAFDSSNLGDDEDEDDVEALPTNLGLMSTMSSDPARSQRDSALLIPRIKFLWESYRAVLDILKSNSKLERLYHSTAVGALRFCSTYNRKMEFRRCCDLLRMHLQNLQKYGGMAAMAKVEEGGKPNNKVRGWEGWTSESIELHLQTRFVQLDTASALHLYTEGFRTIEDIFNILQTSHTRKKVAPGSATPLPKAKLMAAYYEKLTTLYWVSENYLFHAFAWYKFYTLCREYNRSMTIEQRSLQASAVLLSALCIPESAPQAMNGDASAALSPSARDAKEKTTRMATLLGFHTRNPTREALLLEIRAKNVMDDVPTYLRDLYKLFEENSNPLFLVEKARPLLEKLRTEVGHSTTNGVAIQEEKEEEDKNEIASNVNAPSAQEGTLSAYVQPLTNILLLKLIKSLSKSYHTISLDHVRSLTSGLGVTFTQVEKAIVTSGSGLVIQTSSRKSSSSVIESLKVRIDHRSNCLRFGSAASDYANRLDSDSMRMQLTVLSKQLASVCNIISPPDINESITRRQTLFGEVRAVLEQEHTEMLARKDRIEKRKEEGERLKEELKKVEEQKRLQAQANARVEEEKRLLREQKLREKEKQEQIRKELEATEKKRYLEAMGQNVEALTMEELERMDPDALAREHAAKSAKKKDEEERKVKEMQKKLDYIVRATRIEEVPLVKKRYEEKVTQERERYEADVVEKSRKAKMQWEEDCAEKAELSSRFVFKFMVHFQKSVMDIRKISHKELCKEEDIRAELEAENGKLQRARKRKEEEIRIAKEEEERLKREEEDRKAEEERRAKEEEKRKREQEEAERKKKEMERMESERQKREQQMENNRPPPPSRDLDAASVKGGSTYVPPSKRFSSNGGNKWSHRGGEDRNRSYPSDDRGGGFGGGRYEGGSNRGGYDRDRANQRFGSGSRFGDRGDDRGGDKNGRRNDRGPPERKRW
eukprot:CAMPEP_0184867174 /NCGR_PEP_ID=MMETSP0580-20130426/25278_1 /TAXON_ID=1118495 /ORGANISM="Dactyliosolen fragilissimus" /LENGTH=1007 /DNA_ID=CAMNT_0027367265 /DNA_START=292 /DNA_END=3315 /DNA_ORIENTATION=-